MASPVASLLFPGSICAVSLPTLRRAPAPAPARVRLPPAARRTARVQLRCATTSGSKAAGVDAMTDEEFIASLPAWAPSVEELMELDRTDLSPDAVRERFVRESKEAKAAVKGAVDGMLPRPLRELVGDVRGLKSVYDAEEFHIGIPVGALLACVGFYRLCMAAPSACLGFALPYAFYRLSVMAADVRRRGFAPDFIIRLKFLITIVMLVSGFNKVTFLEYVVRYALFGIYFFSVSWEVKGLKKYARHVWPILIESFTTPQGREELLETLSEMDFGTHEDNY